MLLIVAILLLFLLCLCLFYSSEILRHIEYKKIKRKIKKTKPLEYKIVHSENNEKR